MGTHKKICGPLFNIPKRARMITRVVISREKITLWAENMAMVIEDPSVSSFSMSFPTISDILVLLKGGGTASGATIVSTEIRWEEPVNVWMQSAGAGKPGASLKRTHTPHGIAPLRAILNDIASHDAGTPIAETRFFTAWWVYKAKMHVQARDKVAVWGMLDCVLPGFSGPYAPLFPGDGLDKPRHDALRFKSREYGIAVVRLLRKWSGWSDRSKRYGVESPVLAVVPHSGRKLPIATVLDMVLEEAVVIAAGRQAKKQKQQQAPKPQPRSRETEITQVLQEEYLQTVLALPYDARARSDKTAAAAFSTVKKDLQTSASVGVSKHIKSRIQLWMEHGQRRFFKRYVNAAIGSPVQDSCCMVAAFPDDTFVRYDDDDIHETVPAAVLLDDGLNDHTFVQAPVRPDTAAFKQMYDIDFSTTQETAASTAGPAAEPVESLAAGPGDNPNAVVIKIRLLDGRVQSVTFKKDALLSAVRQWISWFAKLSPTAFDITWRPLHAFGPSFLNTTLDETVGGSGVGDVVLTVVRKQQK